MYQNVISYHGLTLQMVDSYYTKYSIQERLIAFNAPSILEENETANEIFIIGSIVSFVE